MTTCDFSTFCYEGDMLRLHSPGQLKKQVESNDYDFNQIIVVHQNCKPPSYYFNFPDYEDANIICPQISHIDDVLSDFNIKLEGQYQSPTDKHHTWKPHVVNHLTAIQQTQAEYIVFADNDCWIRLQPDNDSWVEKGIDILKANNNIFIVSPNDGEPERITRRMSQQMFLVRVDDFRNMDFNQPGWDGNTDIPGGPMPEYHAMLEGRMHHYCKHTNRNRYVLGSEYRYWHFNKIKADGSFELDYDKW